MLLTVYNSRRDIYGNTYWAYKLTNLDKTISQGKISANNIDYKELREKSIECVCMELPIREFDRLVKDMDYHGCTWANIKSNMML